MDERPKTTEVGGAGSSKTKKFGAAKHDPNKKYKDFIPSSELNPEMKANGFIVDKQYLGKVGKML